MTEAEWLACEAPDRLLVFARAKMSDRKLRLFGCACRRVWESVPDEFRTAVEVAERFADGEATKKRLGVAKKATGAILSSSARRPSDSRVCGAAWSTTRNAATAATYPCWVFTDETDRRSLAALLRDIFDNPFRTVTFDPAWRTSDAMLLAKGIYDEKAFDRTPILADALQDAGCTSDDILNHLRAPHATHVRGCWVLDLVLGKQ
jgi:hypothetical protein